MRNTLLALLSVSSVALTPGCSLFGFDDELQLNLPALPVGPATLKTSALREGVCPPVGAPRMEGSIQHQIAQGFPVDLINDQDQVDVQQYKVDQIKGVTVRNITYSIPTNTMKKSLNSVDIYFGPLSAVADPLDVKVEQGALFGRTDAIDERTVTNGHISVRKDPTSEEAVREYLTELSFSTMFATTVELTQEDCENLGGDLDIELAIQVSLFVDPL